MNQAVMIWAVRVGGLSRSGMASSDGALTCWMVHTFAEVSTLLTVLLISSSLPVAGSMHW